MFIYFTNVHSFHIATRHANTPYSEYSKYYTDYITREELNNHLVLHAGMYLTPERIDRELNRTFAISGINRSIASKINIYDIAWEFSATQLNSPDFY